MAVALIYQWQTLLAGLLALIGAAITIQAMNRQAREAVERKRRAARAMLPSTLASVMDYALASVRWLQSVREKARHAEREVASGSILVGTCPRPNADMTASLRDCVEHLDMQQARFVATLLSKIQVQHSRIADLHDYFVNYELYQVKQVGIGKNIDNFIVNSVEIAAMAQQLFPYARVESEAPPRAIDFDAMASAFHECQLDEIRDVGPWNVLSKRYVPRSDLAPVAPSVTP